MGSYTVCVGEASRQGFGLNLEATCCPDFPADKPVYPMCSMTRPGEAVRVNFGQVPFVFDIDGYYQASSLLSLV